MCVAAIGLIGGLVSGIGAAMAASQQATNYEAQAKAQERQAQQQQMIGNYEATRQQEAVKRVLGSQRASFAANGVALDGSALDVITDTATEGALDVAAIKWNAGMKSDTEKYNSKISKMSAKAAKSSMPFAFLSPVLSSAATFAGTFK